MMLSPTQSNSHWHSSTTVNQQTTCRLVVSNSIQLSLALIDNCQSTDHTQTCCLQLNPTLTGTHRQLSILIDNCQSTDHTQTCCLQLNPTLTSTHRQLSINRTHADLLSPTQSNSHSHSSTTVNQQTTHRLAVSNFIHLSLALINNCLQTTTNYAVFRT